MSIKKTLKAKEQDRKDIQITRAKHADFQAQTPISKLVFLDESSAKTNMVRLYGRAKAGSRCFDSAFHGHWKTLTMLSSVRSNGETECVVFDGATTRLIFETYIEQCLCPVLSAGDIVIMDNLSAHKSKKTQELIEGKGAKLLYLPAYSPDLNPIEKMWSKIKAYLRKAKAETVQKLIIAIKDAFESLTPKDIENWFHSCGYFLN